MPVRKTIDSAALSAYTAGLMATSPKDAAALTPSPRPTKHRGRPFKGEEKINIPEAFKLRLRGWTFDQLAEKYGCNQSSVIRSLDSLVKLVPNPELREAYQQSKAEVLESVQLTMMASLLQPAKMEKATLGNVAYAASKLDEMIRLERGQSTKNINVLSAIIDGTHVKLFGSKQTEQAEPQADANIREITPASHESIEKS